MQLPSRRFCPECGQPTVGLRRRLRVELFGGYVICDACGTYFHIDHKAWWFAGMLLGCEGQLLLLFFLIMLIYAVGWWSVPIIALTILILGYAIAAFSPLVAVEPLEARRD